MIVVRTIIQQGRSLILTPVADDWDSWFDGEGVADDFMREREQSQCAVC